MFVGKAHSILNPGQAWSRFQLHRQTPTWSLYWCPFWTIDWYDKPKMDLTSTISMDFVDYCLVYHDRTHPHHSVRSSPVPTNLSKEGMITFAKTVWETEETSRIRGPMNKSIPSKRIAVVRRHWQKLTASKTPPQRLNSLIKLYSLVPLRWNRHCRICSGHSRQDTARKTEEGGFQESILQKPFQAFH